MEFTVHHQVLGAVFLIAVIMGAVVNKTHFCTMGAVSDWVNIGDTGRMRAWVLSMAVALLGVIALEAAGTINLSGDTFPPYRSANFAWPRYLAGGLLFGIGMVLGSGCGNKTLVRVGSGNLKSLVVLLVGMIASYLMLWSPLFEKAFLPWLQPATINLAQHGIPTQQAGDVVARLMGYAPSKTINLVVALLFAASLLIFVFKSKDFRGSFDNLLSGAVVGLVVVAGWYLTGGALGQSWKEYAEMATDIPSRVQVQSYTFVSPMGDTVRYLLDPTKLSLINFGVVALAGVISGSFIYAITTKNFRIEWFASFGDFVNHVMGGALMGVGGVLSMGCTVGQAITGMSTLAMGSMFTFVAIVAGAVTTMKFQYWQMMRET
ncbi:MAG TPA: YeeE/YedE family protein [Burkholderiales bacterium]|nr:YeeE/YedE family protein [Burkholderiales bacterium]